VGADHVCIQQTGQLFRADVIADALSLSGCTRRDEAYSLLETLRLGMSQVLDREREDLEVLVIGRPGTDVMDALLYDPSPEALDSWSRRVSGGPRWSRPL
jgi:hypothetical protein